MRKEDVTEITDNGHKFWIGVERRKTTSINASKIDTTKMAHFCAQLTGDEWPAQDGSGKGQGQEKLTCEKKREPHQFLHFLFDAFLPKPPCSRKKGGL